MESNMEKLPKDFYLGAGLAAVSAIFLFFVIPKAVVVPSNIKIISLRPDFWPAILCVVIIILSLLLLATSYINYRASSPTGKQPHSSEKIAPRPMAILKPLSVIGVLLLYYFSINFLGIILSSTAALLGLALLYGERNFKVLIPLAIIVPVVLYLFFSKVANVPLPIGDLFS